MLTYMVYRLAASAVELFQWLLIIRALMSWFPQIQQSRIYDFVYTLTEPLLQPCRAFLNRFQFAHNSPFDFSMIIAYLFLCILEFALRAIF